MSKITTGIITVVLATVLVLTAFVVYSAIPISSNPTTVISQNYSLDVLGGEELAVSKARYAVAQSAVDGTGALSLSDCSILGNIVKNADQQDRWFENCSYINVGSTPDTDTEEVLKLSDGYYCATFTLIKEGQELKDYNFTNGECGDTRIFVE